MRCDIPLCDEPAVSSVMVRLHNGEDDIVYFCETHDVERSWLPGEVHHDGDRTS